MKSFALVLLFFASLALSAKVISRLIPPAPIPQFSEKLAHFAAHKDEYDTLFIGSSRTFRQILPSLFDPLMAAGGQPARSFNFGLDGMFSPEDAYVAEKIFALHPSRLDPPRRFFIASLGAVEGIDQRVQGFPALRPHPCELKRPPTRRPFFIS